MSPRAAMTTCHRQAGLSNRNLLFPVLEAGSAQSQCQGLASPEAPLVGSQMATSSLWPRVPFLCEHTALVSLRVSKFPLRTKTSVLLVARGPTLMTSCLVSHVRFVVIPWTVAHQALLSMGFSGHEYWNELAFSTPRDLPNPEMELRLSVSPSLAGGFFTH